MAGSGAAQPEPGDRAAPQAARDVVVEVQRGKRFANVLANSEPWREIVGVVGALRQDGLDAQPRPEMFVSLEQFGAYSAVFGHVVVRATGDPASLIGPLETAVRAAHPDLLARFIRSMDDIVATQMAPRRFVMWAVGVFGLAAILIAAVGR